MDVLIMQVFVSLLLVAGALVLLAYSVKQADHEHADRLSLFPIEDESRLVGGEARFDSKDSLDSLDPRHQRSLPTANPEVPTGEGR